MKSVRAAAVAVTVAATAAAAIAADLPRHHKQLWGAIAYNRTDGHFGYAIDRASRREAEAEAFRLCGEDCDVIRTFRDVCGAVAENPRHFSWQTGASRAIAERKAMEKCGADCRVPVWACTSHR